MSNKRTVVSTKQAEINIFLWMIFPVNLTVYISWSHFLAAIDHDGCSAWWTVCFCHLSNGNSFIPGIEEPELILQKGIELKIHDPNGLIFVSQLLASIICRTDDTLCLAEHPLVFRWPCQSHIRESLDSSLAPSSAYQRRISIAISDWVTWW